MMTPLHLLVRGSTPLLINVPHAGTEIPSDILGVMTPEAWAVPDTDWHVPFLYGPALERGAGLIAATHSRYVVDLNRPPDGKPMYSDHPDSALCPSSTFANDDIYLSGTALDEELATTRLEVFWQPYHAVLAAELQLICERHGYAILLDAHSVRSVVPRLFYGRIPDLSLGTADGRSCSPSLAQRAYAVLQADTRYSCVLNGRFKGGYNVRHYGRPEHGMHALQLEISQALYLDETDPGSWNAERAQPLMPLLAAFVDTLLAWRPGS